MKEPVDLISSRGDVTAENRLSWGQPSELLVSWSRTIYTHLGFGFFPSAVMLWNRLSSQALVKTERDLPSDLIHIMFRNSSQQISISSFSSVMFSLRCYLRTRKSLYALQPGCPKFLRHQHLFIYRCIIKQQSLLQSPIIFNEKNIGDDEAKGENVSKFSPPTGGIFRDVCKIEN